MQHGNIPGTSIFVDVFPQPLLGGGVYVLTHAHSDHMAGLSKGWRHGFIHCTKPTADLLTSRFGMSSILRIHCLDVPLDIEDPSKPRRQITGTFVDANHCPGAAMIVLEGCDDGPPIVNTGDFRFSPTMLDSDALRRVAKQGPRLYFDASCAQQKLKEIPTKSASIGMLLDLLDSEIADHILLHSHQIGDEEVLESVAARNDKLWFAADSEDRLKQLMITHPEFCKSNCKPLAQHPSGLPHTIIVKNSRTRETDPRLRDMSSGIEINCSMLWWANRRAQMLVDVDDIKPVFKDGIWRIMLSHHASLNELRRFVAWLRPSSIKPICQSLVDASTDPCSLFSDLLCSCDSPEKFRVFEPQSSADDTHCRPHSGSIDIRTSADEVREFFSAKPMPDDTLTWLLHDDAGLAHLEHDADAVDAADAADAGANAKSPLKRKRALRGVPSAASADESVAATVLDTSEDELPLPLKRMRSWSLELESVQSACAEVINLEGSPV